MGDVSSPEGSPSEARVVAFEDGGDAKGGKTPFAKLDEVLHLREDAEMIPCVERRELGACERHTQRINGGVRAEPIDLVEFEVDPFLNLHLVGAGLA